MCGTKNKYMKEERKRKEGKGCRNNIIKIRQMHLFYYLSCNSIVLLLLLLLTNIYIAYSEQQSLQEKIIIQFLHRFHAKLVQQGKACSLSKTFNYFGFNVFFYYRQRIIAIIIVITISTVNNLSYSIPCITTVNFFKDD